MVGAMLRLGATGLPGSQDAKAARSRRESSSSTARGKAVRHQQVASPISGDTVGPTSHQPNTEARQDGRDR